MDSNFSIPQLLDRIKYLEVRLSRMEAERKAVLDSLPFIAWLKDIEGRYIYINKPFSETFNLTFENIIGCTDFDIFPKERALQSNHEDIQVIAGKNAISLQYKRNNQWYSTVKAPVFDHNGEVIGTTGFERNITDNVEMLSTLRNERDLLQSLMDNIPDAIYFKNVNSTFIRANKSKLKEVGLDKVDDIIGKTEFDFCDEQQANIKLNDEKRIFESGLPLINKEEKIIYHNGKEVWLSTTKSPIQDDKGVVVGLVGISRNISSHKEILDKLDTEREFLQLLMDNIPYTIYFKDYDCKFTKINKAQAKLIGVSHPSEAIGKSDFDFFSEQHAKIAYSDEQRILTTGEPMINKEELISDSDGNMRWVSATKIPLRNNKGEIMGLVGMSIDVTDKHLAAEKLKEAKEKAEESDRLKTAFLANMSHEIRTPMNGIIGFSNLLRNPDLTETDRIEFINHITNCGSSLLNLIDDIIDISKIEAGQIKIRIAESNINPIMNELFDSFQTTKERDGKSHIVLLKTTPLLNENMIILTDPFRFRQIFSNLLVNALKFTLEGTVEFGYFLKDPDTLQFYVKDSGIGIPNEKQELIFERFGQVLDNNIYINQKGTGLGLTISSNLVKLLGGKMWVTSELGKGSTFYFTLPYNYVERFDFPSLELITDISLKEHAGKTILIVEDEDTNCQYFRQILKHSGLKILWAKNGIEAIEAVNNHDEIALILMDCKMPILDGYSATIEIKKKRPQLPIIAQTAYAMTDEQEKSISVGCDAYLSKPIKPRELFEFLQIYLR